MTTEEKTTHLSSWVVPGNDSNISENKCSSTILSFNVGFPDTESDVAYNTMNKKYVCGRIDNQIIKTRYTVQEVVNNKKCYQKCAAIKQKVFSNV